MEKRQDVKESSLAVGTTTDLSAQAITPRTDPVMHEIVETGISIMRKNGSERASQFMSAAGVPKKVALRVLANPTNRRNAKK